MPARLRLSWGMKTLKLFLLPVLDSKSAHLLGRKHSPEETAPPSLSPGISPLVGVAFERLDRMEVCGRVDETQDRAQVA
jgi:hypothetical protein